MVNKSKEHIEHDLFLLMINLTQLKDSDYILQFFMEAMNSIWNDTQFRLLSKATPLTDTTIPISTSRYSFGSLCLESTTKTFPDDHLPLIRNSVKMLAIILENRFQEQLLSDKNIRLETAVKARTEELLETNEQLKETRDLLMNAFDHAPIGMTLVKPDNHFYRVNQTFCNITGYSEEELLSMTFNDITHPEDHHIGLEFINNLIAGKIKKGEFEKRYIRKDTTIIHIHLITTILRDDKGIPLYFLTQIQDITEKKRLAEVVVQTEKMLSVGGLAAGMAHEINNPLSVVLQGLQNISRFLSPEYPKNHQVAQQCGIQLQQMHQYLEQRNIWEFIDGMKDAALRAAKIVQNMLQFSRPSSTFRQQPADLIELINTTLKLAATDYDLKKQYDFRNIEIIKDFAPNLPHVSCNTSEIQQVLLNLLRNAAQAMHEQKDKRSAPPQIILRTKYEQDMAQIEIEDNGPGMDEKIRKRVFEPFFTTKPPGAGTGLGLSVSYFIITNNHKGQIIIDSTPGRGTKFTIQLPCENYLSALEIT